MGCSHRTFLARIPFNLPIISLILNMLRSWTAPLIRSCKIVFLKCKLISSHQKIWLSQGDSLSCRIVLWHIWKIVLDIILLCNCRKLRSFCSIIEVLLFLLIEPLLFLQMNVFTFVLFINFIHTFLHYLVIICVLICGHISCVLSSKLEVGTLEILLWNDIVAAFWGKSSWVKGNLWGSILCV